MRYRVFGLCAGLLLSSLLQAQPATPGDAHGELRRELQAYLFNAARQGDLAVLEEFIEVGYDLDSQDPQGFTPLIFAAYHGHLAAVERLLQAGADPCLSDRRGNTALMGAIFKGELRVARRLLQAGCATDQRNHAGQTPAMYAALFQRLDILEALAEQGADLAATDAMGNDVAALLEGRFSHTR